MDGAPAAPASPASPESPESIVLTIGESHVVELSGPRAAGYAWTFVVEGAEGVLRVAREVLPTSQRDKSALPPTGAGPPQRLVLSATSAGSVRVVLRLARSFEPQRPPLAERTLDVTVQAR